MTLPLGPLAPLRPATRPRDLELGVVGVLALAVAMAVTALQTVWVDGWSDSAPSGVGTLVLVLPPAALATFGAVLGAVAWRRRPFESFWTREQRSDDVRRGLAVAALLLVLAEVVLLVRFVGVVVDAISGS